MVVFVVLVMPTACYAHGQLVFPTGSAGGNLSTAGSCTYSGACYLFTQAATIPWAPTLPHDMRTVNIDVEGGPNDWSSQNPWRSPGSALVRGSGCGVTSGAPIQIKVYGGVPVVRNGVGYEPGIDANDLPNVEYFEKPTWSVGSVQQVAFGIEANHAGGYSYRLCKKDGKGEVSEDCFQKTQLDFVGDKSWLLWPNGTRLEVPLKKTNVGTFPKGSWWARNPIPVCTDCVQGGTKESGNVCSERIPPNSTEEIFTMEDVWKIPNVENVTFYGGEDWEGYRLCKTQCTGGFLLTEQGCHLDDDGVPMTAFPEPYPHISGFAVQQGYPTTMFDVRANPGQAGFPFSIVDQVQIPADLETGEYMLSWRWDAEQANQVWNGCADIEMVGQGEVEPEDVLQLDRPKGRESPGPFFGPDAYWPAKWGPKSSPENLAQAGEQKPCQHDGCSEDSEETTMLSIRRDVSLYRSDPGPADDYNCRHVRCICATPCMNDATPGFNFGFKLCSTGCGKWIDCSYPGCACSDNCKGHPVEHKCSQSCFSDTANSSLLDLPFAGYLY